MSAELDRLAALLARADRLAELELEAKLQWLEDAAEAAEAAELPDGALHLRAVLGAIVQWSQGPNPESETALAELDLLTSSLLKQGLLGMYRSLADVYGELGVEETRQAFLDAAAAVERGELKTRIRDPDPRR